MHIFLIFVITNACPIFSFFLSWESAFGIKNSALFEAQLNIPFGVVLSLSANSFLVFSLFLTRSRSLGFRKRLALPLKNRELLRANNDVADWRTALELETEFCIVPGETRRNSCFGHASLSSPSPRLSILFLSLSFF